MKKINSASSKFRVAIGALSVVSLTILLLAAMPKDAAKREMVVLTTEFGEMHILLYDETPLHKANFLKLVKDSYYNDLLFHRVINMFMLQGGDPDSKGAPEGKSLGVGGPGYTIPSEIRPEFIHKKGALAAARQGDQVNPKKESSGSQFYIVHGKTVPPNQLANSKMKYTEEQIDTYKQLGGTPHLDGEYTVFGEVVEGLNVVDSIAARATDRSNRPLKDISMTMKVVKKRWP